MLWTENRVCWKRLKPFYGMDQTPGRASPDKPSEQEAGAGLQSLEVESPGLCFRFLWLCAYFLPCSLQFLFNLAKEDVEHGPEFRVLLVLKQPP